MNRKGSVPLKNGGASDEKKMKKMVLDHAPCLLGQGAFAVAAPPRTKKQKT